MHVHTNLLYLASDTLVDLPMHCIQQMAAHYRENRGHQVRIHLAETMTLHLAETIEVLCAEESMLCFDYRLHQYWEVPEDLACYLSIQLNDLMYSQQCN